MRRRLIWSLTRSFSQALDRDSFVESTKGFFFFIIIAIELLFIVIRVRLFIVPLIFLILSRLGYHAL